jgi:hypothetical protein
LKDILAFLNALLPVLSGIGGAFIGGYFTRKSQQDLLNKEIAREENKEKRKEARETLQLYNQILKIDGEEALVIHIGGPLDEFNIKIYQEKIRPIIYEKFHLIHKDVAAIIREIDHIIAKCNYMEEITDDDHILLSSYYSKLMIEIQSHIESYRNENSIF